jgi:hypothetical protein|tara:strand:+ start:165 stop:566 length:402 start_codon:yes stop_codon:yes gene_type:complete
MNKLMDKLGISKSDIVASAPVRAKGKETTDSDRLRQVRLQMNNTFISHSELVNNATYFEPIYKRDDNGRITLDKNKEKAIEGYKTKTLCGQYVVEDNGDGTHTATKFNVYKDTYLIDSNSLSITQVTNGKAKS